MDYASYFESVNIQDLSREFPIGDSFAKQFAGTSVDQLRQQQTRRLQQVLNRAAKIPFYQRLWGEAGVDHRDIKSVDDIARLPSFGKAEIMASIEAHPPFGDHHGRDIPVAGRIMPMLLHSTSGTTGRPQPLLFSPRTREVHKLMLARAYLMQGLGPADVVHSLYGHGPVNGGHYVREAVIHYTSAVFFPAGTGAETSSVKQIEFMREYGATVLVGFADYMLKLATVAREAGLEPGTDLPVRMISGHLSPDARDSLSQAWGGADLYDWYGVGDTGLIAAEGPDHDGMHVMEDAHCLELCDVETGAPITSPGMPGDMIVTCLFADDIFPIIRFNTRDVSEYLPGQSAMQLPFRRIRGFLGRSDNMVKLRGINVYPQAFASLLSAMPGFTGEYICVATAVNERDTLTIKVEINQPATDTLKTLYQQALKSKLGVEILVELVAPDSLASLTGVASRQKPIRLIDER